MRFRSSLKIGSILKDMSTSELNKDELEKVILQVRTKKSNPSALELKSIRDIRNRIRKEEIANTLNKYKEYAKAYHIDAIIKSNHVEASINQRVKYVFDKDESAIAQACIASSILCPFFILFFVGISLGSLWPLTSCLVPLILILGRASQIKFVDKLKIKGKYGQLILEGPKHMIDEVMPSEIDATMEKWILDKEYEELEKANPEDILDLYQ